MPHGFLTPNRKPQNGPKPVRSCGNARGLLLALKYNVYIFGRTHKHTRCNSLAALFDSRHSGVIGCEVENMDQRPRHLWLVVFATHGLFVVRLVAGLELVEDADYTLQ